jgi:hypothetical protein
VAVKSGSVMLPGFFSLLLGMEPEEGTKVVIVLYGLLFTRLGLILIFNIEATSHYTGNHFELLATQISN